MGEPDIQDYRCLLLAIIAQAVDDARRHLAGQRLCNDPHRTAGAAALKWMESKDFTATCDLADLNFTDVRAAALSAPGIVDRRRGNGKRRSNS